MALFDAPFVLEDHAARACLAALYMLNTLKSAHANYAVLGAANIELRIGIHSAEVTTRPVASDSDVHYGVTGETVHLAARMEQNAEPGSAYISQDTYELTGGSIRAEALGPMQIKGLPTPVSVYRLAGGTARPFRYRSRAEPLMPFLGRKKELRLLTESCRAAEAARGRALLLTGEPGSGKSRLVQHFIEAHVPHNWLIIRCEGLPHGAFGHNGIRSFVANAIGLPEIHLLDTGGIQIQDRISRTLMNKGSEHAVAIASLFKPPGTDEMWDKLEPKDRRQRVEVALFTLLAELSRERPVLVVVEDAHNLDEASMSYISAMFRQISRQRVLVVVTMRSDSRDGIFPNIDFRVVDLGTITEQEVAGLVGSLFHATVDVRQLTKRLREITNGNPLYLEQCLYALARVGIISGRDFSYVVKQSPTHIKLPASIRALLASRVDRLSDLAKDVLQAASVAGEIISSDLLAGIMGMSKFQLNCILGRLRASGFLVAKNESRRHKCYSFIHGLMQETLYESVPRRSKVALHARMLAILEKQECPNDELLADHAMRGEAWDRRLSIV